jgi:hypothetical protein
MLGFRFESGSVFLYNVRVCWADGCDCFVTMNE